MEITVDENLINLISKIGEKITIRDLIFLIVIMVKILLCSLQ